MAQLRVVKINDISDGDASSIPNTSQYRQYNPPTLYLEKLGTEWMKSSGKALPGLKYRLNKLPDGYTVWERPRPSDPSHLDRYCFGHPARKWFDSPNKFLPHFLNLMEKGSSEGCNCVNCNKTAKKPHVRVQAVANTSAPRQSSAFYHAYALPSRNSAQPSIKPAEAANVTQNDLSTEPKASLFKAKGRQWVEGRTDEEGTPDPYRNNIDRLKALGSLDTIIEETMSADWRAERKNNIESYFKKLKQKPSWLPRQMEIVLFVRSVKIDERISFHPKNKKFMIHRDDGTDPWREPLWEAGVVTQTSRTDLETDDAQAITNSGFRIEPLSNANLKDDKGIWKRYSYLRYDQIRPFNLWKNFLTGIEPTELNETINNAMLVMSTLTLIKRYRFKGKWPTAKVFCRAMYVGAELIIEGDFVCLLPESDFDRGVTDIMQIEAITLDMWNLDRASDDDYDDGHPYNSAARITGKVYTNLAARAANSTPVQFKDINNGLNRLGPWYSRTPHEKLSRIPFHRVLGRFYNPDVLDAYIHSDVTKGQPLTKLGVGMSGVMQGRSYSSEEYRLIDDGRSWYWADTRVGALDLEEVNGLLVASQDPERDPKIYRKEIRVIEGTARPEERLSLQQADRRVSGRGMNSMLASALELEEQESTETSRDRKRSRGSVGRSQSEDEDEDGDENEDKDGKIEALAMSDEEVSSGSGDDEEYVIKGGMKIRRFSPSAPMVVID